MIGGVFRPSTAQKIACVTVSNIVAHYNSSTGKASYNASTGKAQTAIVVACDLCNNVTKIKATLTDVTVCCAEMPGFGGWRKLIGPIVATLEGEHILKTVSSTETSCLFELTIDTTGLGIIAEVWEFEQDCIDNEVESWHPSPEVTSIYFLANIQSNGNAGLRLELTGSNLTPGYNFARYSDTGQDCFPIYDMPADAACGEPITITPFERICFIDATVDLEYV